MGVFARILPSSAVMPCTGQEASSDTSTCSRVSRIFKAHRDPQAKGIPGVAGAVGRAWAGIAAVCTARVRGVSRLRSPGARRPASCHARIEPHRPCHRVVARDGVHTRGPAHRAIADGIHTPRPPCCFSRHVKQIVRARRQARLGRVAASIEQKCGEI